MGMSTHVIGFKPPDEKWRKMKAVWDACEEADLPIPEEVEDFFECEKPDPTGVEVKISARRWNGESADGYEIDITKLPKDVKIIRFYNSY